MTNVGPEHAADRRSWWSNVLTRTTAVVLMATAVPVVSLVWASGVARAEVEQRALDGLASTAKATVLQEQQAWDDAVRVITAAASRPVPLSALQSRDTTLASQGVQNVLITGPFAAVRLYGSDGGLVAEATLPGVTPTPFAGFGAPPLTFGEPVIVGSGIARQVAVGIGPGGGGRLVVDVDVTQLLGKPSDLAFGQTGVKFLVTSSGTILAGSTAVGTTLQSDVNRSIVAAGRPVTKVVYSPFFRLRVAESYEPIPGQRGMGILVQQSRSEVMGDADGLAALLRWTAVLVGLLGAILAVGLRIFLRRRTARLATSESRLAHSEAESRRRLEQFLDAIPIGVFVASPDGQPRYANREAARLLGRGISPGAPVDEGDEVFTACVAGSGDPYPAAAAPLRRALAGETAHVDDMEIRGAGPDDTPVPVEVWGTPVLGDDGSVEFGITAIADVSDRRRAAERLQVLSAITASMSEGVMLLRTDDFTIAYANGSYEAMFGYEPGELVGRRIRDLAALETAATSDSITEIRDALRATGTWRGDVHGVRKDGSSLWCAVNVAALDHPTIGPAWIAVNTDITARREAQEAQARLASIVQASRDAILGKTLDGVVTSWNHGAEVLFGYTAAEMIGGPIEVLIPPQGRDDEAELRARVAQGLGVEHYESVRVRKNGTLVDVSATLSPIRDADGRIVGIATICRDVTVQKRAEEALLDREEQLAAARDQALEASRLKSQFLANMSHEIRTPMNGVLGMAQLLLTGHLEPEQRRRALRLHESGQSLLTIINDILDVSKMEAGKLRLETASFNLAATVDGVVSVCATSASDRGLTLTVQVAPGVPAWVRGDPLRLRQILVNIVGNAVKFTEKGGVDVSITQVRPDAVRFTVQDTGIGLDPSAKAYLLEPFSQADASTTRRFGGTGLGLAICRQLVELMGGTLDFTSERGVGTAFWFELDLPAAEPGDDGAVGGPDDGLTLARALGGPHPGAGKGVRILLVDDVAINREVGKGLMESLGYEVDTVSSGADAVAAVLRSNYTAVLMDCLMPVMDGYEATARIRSLDGPAGRVPIIALTAAAMSDDRDRCLAAGMDDYISKPLDLGRLATVLARCRSESGARQAVAAPVPDRVEEPIEAALGDRLEAIRSNVPPAAFETICELFLSSTPGVIDRLGAAVRAGDADTARDAAHNLKGSMATVGAVRLSALAERLEAGVAGSEAGIVLRQIDEEYDRARTVICSLMTTSGG